MGCNQSSGVQTGQQTAREEQNEQSGGEPAAEPAAEPATEPAAAEPPEHAELAATTEKEEAKTTPKKKGLLKLGGDGENPNAAKEFGVQVNESGAIEISEAEKALEGAPQGELFTVELKTREQLEAFDGSEDMELTGIMPTLTQEDAPWNIQFDSLTTLRRLLVHHVSFSFVQAITPPVSGYILANLLLPL